MRLRKCNIQYRKLPHHLQNSHVARSALQTDKEELEPNGSFKWKSFVYLCQWSMVPFYASESIRVWYFLKRANKVLFIINCKYITNKGNHFKMILYPPQTTLILSPVTCVNFIQNVFKNRWRCFWVTNKDMQTRMEPTWKTWWTPCMQNCHSYI